MPSCETAAHELTTSRLDRPENGEAAEPETAAATFQWRPVLRRWLPGILGIVVIGLSVLAWRHGAELSDFLSQQARSLEQRGWLGALGFVALGSIWMVALLPASVVFLSAGAVWGLGHGLVLAATVNVLAGAASFGISRRLFTARAQERDPRESKLALVRAAVQQEGLTGALLLRFSALPAWTINYGLGASGLPWRHYLLASVAILPNTWLFVAAGDTAGMAGAASSRSAGEWALLATSLLATAIGMFLLGKRAKDLLDRTLSGDEGSHGRERASKEKTAS